MFGQGMHQTMAGVAQTDEIVCSVVLPIAVKMVYKDRPVLIRDIAQDAAALVPLPGRHSALAILLAQTPSLLFFQRLALQMHNASLSILSRAPQTIAFVADTKASRRWSQGLRAQRAQTLIDMGLLRRPLRGIRFVGTVLATILAQFCRLAAVYTRATTAFQDFKRRLFMNAKYPCGFAHSAYFRKDRDNAVIVNGAWSRHSAPFSCVEGQFSPALNCTNDTGERQYISHSLMESFA